MPRIGVTSEKKKVAWLSRKPRGVAGWRRLEAYHRDRIWNLRRQVEVEYRSSRRITVDGMEHYFADIDRVTGAADEACGKLDTREDLAPLDLARERAVVWERAVADLIEIAYGYWKAQGTSRYGYCSTGWNVVMAALSCRRSVTRDYRTVLSYTGPGLITAEQMIRLHEGFAKVIADVTGSCVLLPGYPATQGGNTRRTDWELPLHSGQVPSPLPNGTGTRW